MISRIRIAALILENGKILLVNETMGFNCWVPPGGGLEEKDASIYDCAKREVFEETGLKIKLGTIKYIREFYDTQQNILNIEIFIVASVVSGTLTLENLKGNGPDEFSIVDVNWFSKDQLSNLEVFPEILKDDFWNDLDSKEVKYLGRTVV